MGKVRWKRFHLDAVLVACVVALFSFPLGAAVVARGLPIEPAIDAAHPAAGHDSRRLRVLPAFGPRSALERQLRDGSLLTDGPRMRRALGTALGELLGRRRSRAVMRLMTSPNALTAAGDGASPEYPFRYPPLEPILESALPARLDSRLTRHVNEVAALLVLAAASDDDLALPGAPAAAFALLHRARAERDCLAQLNLAFLLSTAVEESDPRLLRALEEEFGRAERACPRDLTARWTLGQLLSASATSGHPQLLARARAAFRGLQRRAPGSALGWSGEADAELRLAYHSGPARPFTARAHFRRALVLYRHASQVDPQPALAAGTARALAGLGDYGAAAAEQRRALAGRSGLVPVAARLVEYLERDQRFDAAAAAARPLVVSPVRVPPRALIAGGPERFPFADDNDAFDSAGGEDALEPLSIGVDRMQSVALRLGGGEPASPLPLVDSVTDLSFVPQYRAISGVTGHERWCPSWSVRRDRLLSGDPRGALAGLPAQVVDVRSGMPCDIDLAAFGAVATLELGREGEAVQRLRPAGPDALQYSSIDGEPAVFAASPAKRAQNLSDLHDMRQNLWRFAGRLGRARAAALAWLKRIPGDPRAADRLGEIAFLARDFDGAARWFGRSVRYTRSTRSGWTAQEAWGLVKRGTALRRAGQRGAAVAVLERADEIATRAAGTASDDVAADDPRSSFPAQLASYHARVQLGDTLLRSRRYADAAEAYTAAREREPQLRARSVDDLLARPEALHNNQAIAEAKLGHHEAAVAAARTAVAADPLSAVFRETEGYALRRAGRLAEAERAYAAAVRADPTRFPAWNDLGFVRARQGRLAAAAQAFRRAVGANRGYALGWFNLGVAQARRGPAHALSSQGAFGRAFGRERSLRDRDRRFIADDRVFFTNLDLSKPLPPRWSFADTQEQAPVAAAGLVLALLLGARLGRSLVASRFGGDLAGRLMEPMMSVFARVPRLPQFTPWIVGALATIAVFGVGLVRPGGGSIVEAILVVLGVIALVALVVRGRMLAARRAGVVLGQRGWTPGIALAALVAAAGSAWAPLPVAEPSAPAPGVHWVGPLLTALAALGLLVLGVWLSIPSTLALAAVAIVMTASLLTPTKPLDGGFVATGSAGVAAGLALLAGGLFFALGVG